MVYVDSPVHPYGRMLMCHMFSDTQEELVQMAIKIGVNTKWIQYPGTNKEHFDICKSKRALAVKYGAKEVTTKDIVRLKFYKIEKIKPLIK